MLTAVQSLCDMKRCVSSTSIMFHDQLEQSTALPADGTNSRSFVMTHNIQSASRSIASCVRRRSDGCTTVRTVVGSNECERTTQRGRENRKNKREKRGKISKSEKNQIFLFLKNSKKGKKGKNYKNCN